MGSDLKLLLRAAEAFTRNDAGKILLFELRFFLRPSEAVIAQFVAKWYYKEYFRKSWDRLWRCFLEEFLEKNGRLEELRALQTGNSEDCTSLYRNEGPLSFSKFLESVKSQKSGELRSELKSYLSYVRDLDTEGLQPPFKPVNSAHPANLGECRNAWSSAIYAIVVSAISLLSLVYQYLAGCVDRGGSKADSSGSLEYRDIYVAIVLFRGAYVWIKFRDVAPQKALPKSAVREVPIRGRGGIRLRYETRFKPRKENGEFFEWTSFGRCVTRREAEIRYLIVASCYDYTEVDRKVDLGDGRFFTIPELSEEEKTLSGKVKLDWIRSERIPEVYAAYERERDLPVALSGANSVRPSLPDPEPASQLSGRNVAFPESQNLQQQPPTIGYPMASVEYPTFLQLRRPDLTLNDDVNLLLALQGRRRQELELQERRELEYLLMQEAQDPHQAQFHQLASEPISVPPYPTGEEPHLQQQQQQLQSDNDIFWEACLLNDLVSDQ